MKTWHEILMPSHEERLWELYHENSKTAEGFPQEADRNVQEVLDKLHVDLPVPAMWSRKMDYDPELLSISVHDCAASIQAGYPGLQALSFNQLSTILRLSMISVSGKWSLMPLEIFGRAMGVDDMPSGLFHVNRTKNEIQLFREIHEGQSHVDGLDVQVPGVVVYITGVFERSASLFGEKGYRFAVSESGRLVQSILFAAAALGVPARQELSIHERGVERFLGIDGVGHAVLDVIMMNP